MQTRFFMLYFLPLVEEAFGAFFILNGDDKIHYMRNIIYNLRLRTFGLALKKETKLVDSYM